MKNLSIITIVIFLMTAISCKETLLDEYNPSGTTAEAVYATPAGFDALVNAAYSYQRWWYGKEEGYNISEMGTDIWTSGSGDIATDLSQYINLQGTNALLATEWNALYAGVNLCNAGINRISKAGYTAAQAKQREGELRFLRAFYYWHIVETWGGVHFTTEETTTLTTTANKTPVDAFYTQIFADLQIAVTNLSNTTTDAGRVTRPAAMAFLARMYLTRGKNAEANAMARAVINGGFGYALQPVYGDLWKMSNNKNNKEVLYTVNYADNLTLNDLKTNAFPQGHGRGSNSGHMLFGMIYDKSPGMFRIVEYGRPFNRYMPTRALLDLYAPEDARYEGSFNELWFKCAGPSTAGYPVPGDTGIIATRTNFAGSTATPAKYVTYNRNAIYNANGTAKNKLQYPTLTKFMDNTRLTFNEAQSSRDVFVIRLPELYLIAAEAQMKLGNLDSAAINLNVIRTRAAKPGQTAAMQVTKDKITLDFILDERAREFAGEQMRWFDLKRTGKLLDRIKALNPDITLVQDFHNLRPIPQAQLDAVTNRDEFKQNPGYQ